MGATRHRPGSRPSLKKSGDYCRLLPSPREKSWIGERHGTCQMQRNYGKRDQRPGRGCIGCGAPLRNRSEQQPSAARRSDESQYRNIFPDMPGSRDDPPKKSNLGTLIVSALVIGFVVYACSPGSNSSKSSTSSELKGLFACQQAIRFASKDPDKADIPYAEARSVGYEYMPSD